MRSPSLRNACALAIAAVTAAGSLAVVGCGGGGGGSEPVALNLKISESGKAATYQTPKSAEGGLVEVSLKNEGKAPHGVEFIQYTGGHSLSDVLKELGAEGEKIPSWIKLQGGIGAVPGGQSQKATVNLPAGNYVLVDVAELGEPSGGGGPPATAPLEVKGGEEGELPETEATVTAASPAKDKYKWEISGLKAGKNEVTFNSKGGEDAVHLMIAVPLKGKVPPKSQIVKALGEQGPPPSYVEPKGIQSSAVLDGGASETTTIELKKPGKYLFFCPLTDRDGGKPHFEEGLVSVETVK
jgi:hypothetical protein